jgi:hypothetical protein
MKKSLLLFFTGASISFLHAQDIDTLKNHAAVLNLEAGKYTVGGDWGFYVGHNSKEQQQFGEKYLVEDHVHVLGVVAHITPSTGAVTDDHFEIDFRLWEVDAEGKPVGTRSIEDGHLHLEDANLGGPTVIMFHDEAHVEDAFFVTMDLGDYAHDGLAGDTVVPFRNVFQAHSHGAPDWRDFYTQFTTPTQIATHLALYPIVEIESTHIGKISKNGLQIMSPYPNPSTNEITFPFSLKKQASVQFDILDIHGRIVNSIDAGIVTGGDHQQKIDISSLPSGTYILSIISSEGAVGIKFTKS